MKIVLKSLIQVLIFFYSFFGIAQNWMPSYQEALVKAKVEQKPVILVFSGSDWCAPCIKLDQQIWQSSDFKTYALDHYILYKADFPRKKKNKLPQVQEKQNIVLAEKFNINGYFPLVVVLNSDEDILGTLGYKKTTPNTYISNLNTFLQ